MNCEQCQPLLIDYIEDLLDAELCHTIADHLQQCTQCRTEHEALQLTIKQATDNPVPQPEQAFFDAFPEQVLQAYRQQEQSAGLPDEHSKQKKSIMQTLGEWLLPHGWPQLAAQTLVITIAVAGVLFWNFQSSQIRFDSATLQAQLGNGQKLAAVVRQHNPAPVENHFGFSTGTEQANFFKTGTLYSESLALLAGNDRSLLQQYLEKLNNELRDASLTQQLEEISTSIDRESATGQKLLQSLAGLQETLEKLAAQQSARDLMLFQLGSWLTDIQLATALKNTRVVQQHEQADYLITAMHTHAMPGGAISRLEQIKQIMQQDSLQDADFVRLGEQITGIKLILR